MYLAGRVQRLKNRAVRIISKDFDYINTESQTLIKTLNLQTLNERRDYSTMCLIFKCIHGTVPEYLSDQVIMACDFHPYGTRHAASMNIYTPKPKTDF